MTEEETRKAIVAEAESWINTPYVSNGMVKGRRGGVDCAMILIGVYRNVGLLPPDFDPRPYPFQWHLHRSEERYLNGIIQYAKEVPGPPERMPLPGDLVTFKISLTFAHSAIVVDWPWLIHAGDSGVEKIDLRTQVIGKRALAHAPQRFFSMWG
jgi:cell wall-associated NlpC family hydrolase